MVENVIFILKNSRFFLKKIFYRYNGKIDLRLDPV